MLTLFCDAKGVTLEDYTSRGTTMTSESYSDLLKKNLRAAIKQNDVDCCLKAFSCNMVMHGPIPPTQLLQQSQI